MKIAMGARAYSAKHRRQSLEKNTDFVDISVAGFSSSEAKANLNSAVQAFINSHSVGLESMLKRTWITYQPQANAIQMGRANSEKARLEVNFKNASDSTMGAKFESSVVASELLIKQEELIRSLTAEQAGLVDLRTKNNTFPIILADAIFVPKKLYSPKL